MIRGLAWLTLALGALGCNIDPYRLSSSSNDGGGTGIDGSRTDGGGVNDARRNDARPGADVSPNCVPQPESCDGLDNDCDGFADNGFDLQHDPRNCGRCGMACQRTNSFGTCSNGGCVFACLPGFHDLDGNPANGCEYACIPTNDGVERCDGLDNDCDKQIDEGFNLDSDPLNCGSCQHVCVALHATPICGGGKCDYDRQKGCDPPFTDISDEIIGCEYQCQVSPPQAAEMCDNLDNDCDGQIDEGAPGGGDKCGATGGTCVQGTTQCVAGHIVCVGATGQQAEVCDNKDNDCDGEIDEGFDKKNDPRHCGPSCAVCQLDFAIPKCIPGASQQGECAIAACLSGHVDFDNDPSNGCEYACTLTGSEVCDGLDNDCDKQIDEGLTPPTGLCADKGACAGTVAVCAKGAPGCNDETTRWRCGYKAPVETNSCGNLVPQEKICDGLDGDCDGSPDDSFPSKGQACVQPGKIGICADRGTLDCVAGALACTHIVAGLPPSAELCDGVDNDCDGQTDEVAEVVDKMVAVPNHGSVKIDKYEASRPDATATNEGKLEHRACSEANRMPWRNVTQSEAAMICAASGKRLCTESEWRAACDNGVSTNTYPYGASYSGTACNGADRIDGPNDDVVATGSLAGCLSIPGTLDQSGNLKEWTKDETSMGSGQFIIMGGAYDSIADGLTCQFDFVSGDSNYLFDNLGFRCCAP